MIIKRIDAKFMIPISIIMLVISLMIGLLVVNLRIGSLEKQARTEIDLTQNQTMKSLNLIHGSMLDQLKAAMSIFKKNTLGYGSPTIGGTIQAGEKYCPNLYFGSKSVGLDYSIVDELKTHFTTGTATLFVKSESDYVRISTNVKKPDGSRAIGTVLAPTGKAYKAISGGSSFYGTVDILGAKYLTGYEPITNANSETIGIWYVGYPLTSLTAMGEEIKKMKILENGFVALSDISGKVLFHTQGIDTSFVSKLINSQDLEEQWVANITTHEGLGLTLTVAYPQSDIDNVVNSNILWITLSVIAVFIVIMTIIWFITKRTIVVPIQNLQKASEKLAIGDFSVKIEVNSEDEIGVLAKSFNSMSDAVKYMSSEVNRLIVSASEGKLDIRGKSGELQGNFKDIILGFNSALDAIITPLNVSAEYMDRISKGDMPPKITEVYRGDFNEIKNNINQLIDSVKLLISDADLLSKAVMRGDLNYRARDNAHNGDFRKIILGVNSTINRMVGLIDNMPLPVQILDNDFNVLYLNSAAKDVKEIV